MCCFPPSCCLCCWAEASTSELCCGHRHPKIRQQLPSRPLSHRGPVMRLCVTSRLCAVAFLETSASFLACLPALLEKRTCTGIRNRLYLGLGEFGDALGNQKQHDSPCVPCAMRGMLLTRPFWVIPFYLPSQGDFKYDQPAAPARFLPPPVQSLRGPSSPFVPR